MTNIVLNTKTYVGNGTINGVARYREQSGGYATSFSDLTASLRIDSKGRGSWKLVVPTVAAVASGSHEAGDVLDTSDFTIASRIGTKLTTAERTDLADRLVDLVSSAQFRASIIGLEQPAG